MAEGNGMFCVKCGIYTTYMKHIRLKILKNPCKFKDLPEDKWLSKPGKQQATSRLDQEAQKLQDLNEADHDFVWNRQVGRDEKNPDTYGLIFCKKCERTWPWCKRHANIPRSVCQRSKTSAPAPDWVKKFDSVDTALSENSTSNQQLSQAPRRRIRGKSRSDVTPSSSSNLNTENVSRNAVIVSPAAASSGGSTIPRAGVG